MVIHLLCFDYIGYNDDDDDDKKKNVFTKKQNRFFFSLSYVNEQVHCFHLYTQNYLDDFLIYSLNKESKSKNL